jgi:hypothetical protein
MDGFWRVREGIYHLSTSGLLGVLEYPMFKRYSRPRVGTLYASAIGLAELINRNVVLIN